MPDSAPEMYVELLKRALIGELAAPVPLVEVGATSLPERVIMRISRRIGFTPARTDTTDPVALREGRLFPPNADSMIGRARMDNIHECATAVLQDGIPGDFIETGFGVAAPRFL
jgi:O-methyltransferase